MEKSLFFILLSALCFSASPGILSHLVSPAPARERDSAYVVIQLDVPAGAVGFRMGDWNPVAGACIGVGLAYKRQIWTGRNYTTFSLIAAPLFFPFTISEDDPFPWKIGAGIFATAFDGWCIGIGVKSGEIEGSKWNRGMIFLGRDIDKWWKNK